MGCSLRHSPALAVALAFDPAVTGFTGEAGDGEPVTVAVTRAV